MKSRYQIVTCLHGDEPFPLYASVASEIAPIIGNPAALLAGKRFLEKDLNACFGDVGDTTEHRRARELLTLIPQSSVVLDFHTFSCQSAPFCIVVDKEMIPLARRTGVKHIIVMRFNIKNGHALINHRRGISIEVGSHQDSSSFATTQKILRNLEFGEERPDALVYESVGTLETPCAYPNLNPTPEGWVPLLAGERAYQHFGIKVVPVV